MVRTLAELDYTPLFADGDRLPAMITLTHPGDWETVASDGKNLKRRFEAWRKRYHRAWGEKLRCVWKLEFQRRGAPHLHLWMLPPRGATRKGSGVSRLAVAVVGGGRLSPRPG